MSDHSLVFGVGSPHGDDQVGWKVIELLRGYEEFRHKVLSLKMPIELVDGLCSCSHAVIVDACQTGAIPGAVAVWKWPHKGIAGLRSFSSHNFGMGQVLDLIDKLGQLPARTVLLGVEIDSCRVGDDLSPSVRLALPKVVRLIRDELGSKYSFASTTQRDRSGCRVTTDNDQVGAS
jgi:hydrogenase maturation protease